MINKICKYCSTEKALDCFNANTNTSDRRSNRCKSCESEYKKEWTKKNKEEIKARRREKALIKYRDATHKTCRDCKNVKPVSDFYKCSRELYQRCCKACEKKYKETNAEKQIEHKRACYLRNIDRYKTNSKEWRKNNREKDNVTRKLYYINNPDKKLIHNQRTRISSLLRHNKSTKTLNLIGCNSAELRLHLESKFTRQMSWSNYGTYWEVDHVIPCASFDLTDPEQQKQCFHYTNLQPLPCVINRSKQDRILEPTQMKIAI